MRCGHVCLAARTDNLRSVWSRNLCLIGICAWPELGCVCQLRSWHVFFRLASVGQVRLCGVPTRHLHNAEGGFHHHPGLYWGVRARAVLRQVRVQDLQKLRSWEIQERYKQQQLRQLWARHLQRIGRRDCVLCLQSRNLQCV